MAKFEVTIVKGHQVASGVSENSPYPQGTILLQKPYFKELGLDLDGYYLATINAQFLYQTVKLIKWDHEFKQVKWINNFPSETFYFAKCAVSTSQQTEKAFIYQPDLTSKLDHFQAPNVLEIIAPKLKNVGYGDNIFLTINDAYLQIG